MTYEERLKQLHLSLLEFATNPSAPSDQIMSGLIWLRRELDLQIVALTAEAAEANPEPPEDPPAE